MHARTHIRVTRAGQYDPHPPPCCTLQGVLQRDGLGYYNALLLATGVNRPIFAAGAWRLARARQDRTPRHSPATRISLRTQAGSDVALTGRALHLPPFPMAVRNFTIFAPTDAAVQRAYDAGTFDYAQLFATDKKTLAGIVAYHAVPQVAVAAPGKYTGAMSTMLDQGQGKASCANPALSWRPDGFVYGAYQGWHALGCHILQADKGLQGCVKCRCARVCSGPNSADPSAAVRSPLSA